MSQPLVIDVHSHAIFPIGQATFAARQPDWSPESAIALMDESGIDHAIISVPDAANFAEGREAADIARRINEKIADMMVKYPKRFGGFATVPGRDPDGALREIEYALDTLKLDALGTTTSINDVYLGDRRFDPWFEEANRRGVPLFIHPTRLSLTERMDLGMNVAVLEFMFDTTRMLMNMVLEGTKKKYPAIKMISTHGGGTMPFLVERAQILLTHYGAGRDRAPISAAEIKEVLGSFYFDLTAATTDIHLAALLDLVPPTQLLMGFDIPYMPPSSFKPAIERINASPRFTESERKLVFQDNAARLFPAAAARLGLGA